LKELLCRQSRYARSLLRLGETCERLAPLSGRPILPIALGTPSKPRPAACSRHRKETQPPRSKWPKGQRVTVE
jgi:hypothetical protein